LQAATGKQDKPYHLKGIIELDDGFFTVETEESEKNAPLKQG
jgi:hypothetical protein